MPEGPGAGAKALSCFKILFMVVLTLYLWTYSAEARLSDLALAETLAGRGQIPQKESKKNKTAAAAPKAAVEVPASVATYAGSAWDGRYVPIVNGENEKDSNG